MRALQGSHASLASCLHAYRHVTPPAQAIVDHDSCALLQREREPDLHKLARALLDHETLDAEDIKAVLNGTFTRVPVGGQEAAGEFWGLG